MAKPPAKMPPVVEVYRRRGAPAATPAGDRPAEGATTLPATPAAKASGPAAPETPEALPFFGPFLPSPRRFAREPVDLASLPPMGEPVHLPDLAGVSDAELPAAIARALNETAPAPCELIRRIGEKRGAAFLRARYARTRAIEAQGGRALKTLQRRRTPGGCFFVECDRRMPAGQFSALSSLSLLAVGLRPHPSYPP